MSLDPEQIELPHSLAVYLDSLPTQEELASQYIEKAKWMPIKN
jgi:hypothetical protein